MSGGKSRELAATKTRNSVVASSSPAVLLNSRDDPAKIQNATQRTVLSVDQGLDLDVTYRKIRL